MTESTALPRRRAPEPEVRSYALGFAFVAAAVGVLAGRSPALAPVAVVALVFVVAAFRDLMAGVAMFTTLVFFQGLSGAVRPSLAAAGIVLVLAAFRRGVSSGQFSESVRFAVPVILLAGWGTASMLWAPSVRASYFPLFELTLVAALVLVLLCAVRDGRHPFWLVWAYIGGAAGSAVVGLLTPSPAPGRVAGGLGDPNFLAAMVASALVLVPFLYGATRTLIARWLLACTGLLFVLTLFLTQSRGGLIALGAGIFATLAFGGRLRRHALVALLLAVALAGGYYAVLAPPQAVSRVTHFGGGSGRTDIWSVAARVSSDHPLTGVGIGNFRVVEPSYAAHTLNISSVRQVVDERLAVHNTYLEVLAELGVVGLVAFGGATAAALVLGARAISGFRRLGDGDLEALTRGVVVALITLLTAFVFLSAEYEKQLWLLFGLSAALASIARRRLAALDRPVEERGPV